MSALQTGPAVHPGMVAPTCRVLIVDNDADMCELLRSYLSRPELEIACQRSAEEALATMREREFDVVLADLQLGTINGLQLCERIAGSHPGLPVVVMAALGTLDHAVSALRAGAFDFLTKPFDMETLTRTVERAMRRRRARVALLDPYDEKWPGFDEIICESPAMRRLCEFLKRVAGTNASVLVSGESGTGKELVARALHRCGPRCAGQFVAINCAAMPESLLESLLFGHVKGAFTDAKEPRSGLLVRANGGTLFLDEIGDMPLSLQPKLLRALQEQRVRPVGSDAEIAFKARVVVATNRDIEAEVAAGRFRMDLYFRINVIHLELPPLRDRGGDILLLAQHALRRLARQLNKPVTGISPPAAEKLLAYRWPGNVRELENCIERAMTLTCHEQIVVEDLPAHVQHHDSWPTRSLEMVQPDLLPVEEVERRHILGVMDAMGGNKTLAARVLGLDRKTLYRKLRQYERSNHRSGIAP